MAQKTEVNMNVRGESFKMNYELLLWGALKIPVLHD